MKHDHEVQQELDTAAMELSFIAAAGGFILGVCGLLLLQAALS